MYNKKIKQRVSIMMLLIIILSAIPLNIFAADDGFIFEDSDETILIGYKGKSKEITIPKNVKTIRSKAFIGKQLKSLNLNEGLEEIENKAFANNKIEQINPFPSSLKLIGRSAFADNKIKSIDFSNTSNVILQDSAFKDNDITGEIDLSTVKSIPQKLFFNNKIEELKLSSDLTEIGDEAFLSNNLSKVSIPGRTKIGKDVFAANGRYVIIESNLIKSEKSEYHQYGHLVNPVDIEVRYLERIYKDGKPTDNYNNIRSNKKVKFDPYNEDGFFTLNEKSSLRPEDIVNYTVDTKEHKDGVVTFVPNKNNFIVNVIYERIPDPVITPNKDIIAKLLEEKKEGDDISQDELLSLVSAADYKGNDISKNIQSSPSSIVNAEIKAYEVNYSVKDNYGLTSDYTLTLPIEIDPYKIKIADTEWQLGDFIYKDNSVIDLSEKGKEKAKLLTGIAIPHINPETMEEISIIDFKDYDQKQTPESIPQSVLKDHIRPGKIVFAGSRIRIIKDASFSEIPITNDDTARNLDSLRTIGDYAFYKTNVQDILSDMDNLRYVGNDAFRDSDVSKGLDNISVSHIGDRAFKGSKLSEYIHFFQTEYIGEEAFYKTNISGVLDSDFLEYIGKGAFKETNVERYLTACEDLKYIGDEAFMGSTIGFRPPGMPPWTVDAEGSLSEAYMPKLEYVGDRAFKDSEMSYILESPELEYIGDEAYLTENVSNYFPKLPKIKHIGDSAFKNNEFFGKIDYMPQLKYIGDSAFEGTGKLNASFPNIPEIEYIGENAFYKSFIVNSLHDMPKLRHIGASAFEKTRIKGSLPSMNKINEIGPNAFLDTDIKKDVPLYIDKNTTIFENTFKLSESDNEQLILFTKDELNAPNVEKSKYHILNPQTINFVGLNTNNKEIVNTNVLAEESGNYISFLIPKISGYYSEGSKTINKNEIVDNKYTYTYKSNKEYLDENGGNKYRFSFNSDKNNEILNTNEIINGDIFLSTVNESTLRNGVITLSYDSTIYDTFVVSKNKFIKEVKHNDNETKIIFNSNLSSGTEIKIPVSFQFKEGVLLEGKEPIHASLYDSNKIKGYDSLKFGVNIDSPIYKSVFDDGYKQVYKNIAVENIKNDFSTSITLNPKTLNLVRDFKEFRVSYDNIEYKNTDNTNVVATISDQSKKQGWFLQHNKYIYVRQNTKGSIDIPPLELEFKNPQSTNESIIVNSTLNAKVNTDIDKYKYIELQDNNEVNIFVEERIVGYVLGKNIYGPHYNGRHSYFYDNINEKLDEFQWKLSYSVDENIYELTLTDHGLDGRMKYTSVDPEGQKVRVVLNDHNGDKIESKIINEKFLIREDIQEDIGSIDLIYYQLEGPKEVTPTIGTKLKDPNKDYFTKGNPNNVNKFYNYLLTEEINSDGSYSTAGDFSFTDVVADNRSVKTDAKITSPASDLSYGKSMISEFNLTSFDLFKQNIGDLQYTALVDPNHRVEEIQIAPNRLASYDIIETKNGYTRIDFNFKDTNVDIISENSNDNLFKLKTTPIDKSQKELKVYGFLHPSDNYDIYGEGEGVLEELDKSKYSYSEATAKITNTSIFSIKNLIGKDDYVGNDITTKPGESFFYRIEINNNTATPREDFELISILPFEDDNNNSNYHNTLDFEAVRDIELPDGFSIKYLNQNNFIEVDENNIIKELSNKSWSSNPSKNTKAIKIINKSIDTHSGTDSELIQIDIPMKTKTDLTPINNEKINTNKFAYTHSTLGYEQALSNPTTQKAEVPVPKRGIKLTKVSMFMGEEDGVIEGVPFALLDADGQIVQRSISDKDGVIKFNNIPIKDYVIKELQVPSGYKDNPVKITIKSEDLNAVNDVYDIGKVNNHRIDKFDILFKNVEIINDLNNIPYIDVGNIYSRDIKSGSFQLINKETKENIPFDINNRIGHSLTLSPGDYIFKQITPPKDNGLNYKHNSLEYQFTIDKFGQIFLSDGNGTSGSNVNEKQGNVVYFPNSVDYKVSKVDVVKKSEDGDLLKDAKFELISISTGEVHNDKTDSSGKLTFTDIKPGLYNLKEIEAPNGYVKTNKIEVFEVPISESKTFNFEFINNKIKVNLNKYKTIASNISDRTIAEKIANESTSSTNGEFIVKEITPKIFEVREVWNQNKITVNGIEFSTDKNGRILDIQNTIPVNESSVLTIENETKIPGHYEVSNIESHLIDYTSNPNFNGLIDIDVEVKPLKGSIYASKYIVDDNGGTDVEESVNGSKYALHVDKGNGYKLLEESTINNNSYTLFKDLNPLYKYKVIETFVPDGQEDSEVKEYEVELNDFNRYTATVIFRSKIPANDSFVSINKINGITKEKLSGVEFTIIDKHGVSQKFETDSSGQILFEDLKYDLAPFTIRETKAKDGYRLNSKDITVAEEDLDNNTVFTVENYQSTEAPETGTLGKTPFVVSAVVLIVIAYILKKGKY